MATFKDITGREWHIRLTIGSMDRVLESTGCDLLDPTGDSDGGVPLMTRLRLDERLLVRVIWELIEKDTLEEIKDELRAKAKRDAAKKHEANRDETNKDETNKDELKVKSVKDVLKDSFDATTIQAAYNAFIKEWADFFRHRRRQDMVAAIEKHEAAVQYLIGHAEGAVNEINVEETLEQANPKQEQTPDLVQEMKSGAISGSSPA